jgi:hypothetical protein
VSIRRASRGGLLSGQQLVAVVSVVQGGSKLRTAITAVVKQAQGDARPDALQPLAASVKVHSHYPDVQQFETIDVTLHRSDVMWPFENMQSAALKATTKFISADTTR